MRRSKTKFLSIFICCIMMVSLIPTVAFAAGTEGIPIDEAHFPDSNFRDHLTRLNDKNVNGVMEPEEIAATIDLTFTGEGVKDLTGLDYFSNLKHFAYYSGGLTSIDVSKLQNLEDLWVSGNELTNLDVSKNTKLKSLSCEANNLAQLDISNNPELVELHCSNNPLTYLDLSNNSKLERIVSYFNQLTSLDTSNTQCRDKQLCLTNSREIQLNGNTFDLSTLKGFDVTKASNWDGGSVKGTILTVDSEASQVTYRYDCGNGNYAIFTLTFKKPEHVHAGVLQPAKKATFTADGSKKHWKCSCGKLFADEECREELEVSDVIISKVSSEVLSTTKYTYDGKVKTPTVTVKNSKGDKLVKGTDYNVSYASGRKSTGRYSVKVTLTGSYSGAKTLYFTIVPKAPTTAKTALYGYDDVKFSWAKATGASGYYVYYKKSSAADYTYAGYTTGISYKKANLADGAKYYFKVIPYKTVNGTKYKSLQYKTAYTYTLKKVSTPSVVKYSSSKVKVKWSNIPGESGYQISKSTSKTGTNIVSTYSTTAGTYKTISAAKGKTYYYKVRAYKVVNGSRVYAPWSYVKSYRLSSGSTQTTTTKVYTTATGKRYHRIKTCSGLSNARAIYTTTKANAISQGLTPCKICY